MMKILPEEFRQQSKRLLGKEYDDFISSLDNEVPVSIRVNPKKEFHPKDKTEKVAWCKDGYYLSERPSFTFDPFFHAGRYYSQEASSMFLGKVLEQLSLRGIRILDLCAAPGGKSTHILSCIDENSLLVSNEVIRSRANILAENITKWGYPNVVVTNSDPSHVGKLTNYFDVMVVDAPCSGEGMFRKDETAIKEWSLNNVQLCKERQQRILQDSWSALKPGGYLIYSTCTYNTAENEENVEWILNELGAEPIQIDIPEEWGISGALKGELPVYRFLPHKTKGEGFFLAVVRKKGEVEKGKTNIEKKKKKNSSSKKEIFPLSYTQYIQHVSDYSFVQHDTNWLALPSVFEKDYEDIKTYLKVISAGIPMGQIKGKDFIPAHGLALSTQLNRNAFCSHEVDWQTAVSYFRRESFTLPSDMPKGYILLTFENIPIGFVKNIGQRINNLYPNEWRIRTGNLPTAYIRF